MIPYGRQNINQEDIDSVVEVLRSDYITQGQVLPKFESEIANYCGAKNAVATNSATSALHIACLSLELQPGDIVWTSPITFVASANCARYCGADVDFVDINKNTWNMSIPSLKEKLKQAEALGKLPKIIICVHLGGQSCEMQAIYKLSKQYGFRIIEDASHAIGGKYLNKPVGCCDYSDICVFSFHPVKIITTGEGGAALTNNDELAQKMYRLRSHGVVRRHEELKKPFGGPWYYEQQELGFNYRMTDIQAALGLSQLKRLDHFIMKRHEIAGIYTNLLKEMPVFQQYQHPDTLSAYHLFIIRLDTDNLSISHNHLFENLRSSGILVNLHYIPVYKHPYYEQFNYDNKIFPESERYYKQAISLPIFPTLSRKQIEYVVNVLKQPIGHQTIF